MNGTHVIDKKTNISLEAECGTVGSLWNTVNDSKVSNEEYVTIKSGNKHDGSATQDSNGHLSYSFNLSNSGNYKLWARVFTPSASNDSFYIRVDDGEWKTWNNIAANVKNDWAWDSGFNFELTAGEHTLTIAYREDGALLDKLYFTKDGDTPTDIGDSASNCSPLSVQEQIIEVDEVLMYPNPVSDILSIYLPENENKSTKLYIYNTNGTLVKTIAAKNGDNKVDLTMLTNGLYFIVFNINNKVYNRKFAKK